MPSSPPRPRAKARTSSPTIRQKLKVEDDGGNVNRGRKWLTLLNRADENAYLAENQNHIQKVRQVVRTLYPNHSTGVALLEEELHRDGNVQLLINPWIALVLSGYHSGAPQGHYDVGLDADRNLKMQIDAYHGCPPQAALMMVQSTADGLRMRQAEDGRFRRTDKVKDTEVYAGKLHLL